MKKQIILIILTVGILTFIIFNILNTQKINYVALGDYVTLGANNYSTLGYSFSDYYKDYLKSNNKLKSYTKEYSKRDISILEYVSLLNNNSLIKNLNKANIVTITIGNQEIINFNDANYLSFLKAYQLQMDLLINKISSYTKGQIVFIGQFMYKKSKILNSVIDINRDTCIKYNCQYIEANEFLSNNESVYINSKSSHLNYKGQKLIFENIRKNINLSS